MAGRTGSLSQSRRPPGVIKKRPACLDGSGSWVKETLACDFQIGGQAYRGKTRLKSIQNVQAATRLIQSQPCGTRPHIYGRCPDACAIGIDHNHVVGSHACHITDGPVCFPNDGPWVAKGFVTLGLGDAGSRIGQVGIQIHDAGGCSAGG